MTEPPDINMTAGDLVQTAGDLVQQFGTNLIGQRVITPAMGDYPGGVATIVELEPDPAAPEIVFQVILDGWGDIGVFAHEFVSLVGHAP